MKLVIRYFLLCLAIIQMVSGSAFAMQPMEIVPLGGVEQTILQDNSFSDSGDQHKQLYITESSQEEETNLHTPSLGSALDPLSDAFLTALFSQFWSTEATQVYQTFLPTLKHLPLYVRFHNFRL